MLVVILSWVFALVVTLVILGFCAYELTWKLRRLRGDADRLSQTVADLVALQSRLANVQLRAAAVTPPPVPED